MKTFLLVHGAWHGAWCWYKLAPRLQRAGHRVIAPDLLGMGRDRTALGEITLARWADQIANLVRVQEDPVTLVGHSRGGIVISEVAERCWDRIDRLVYLAAFLLRDGEHLIAQTQQDAGSLIPANRVIAADQRSATIRAEAVQEMFYGLCSDEDVFLARSLLCAEPVAPLLTPLQVSEERWGRVPRTYIHCRRDRALSFEMQQRLVARTPCDAVRVIDTDHSPFLSRPEVLSEMLLD